MTSERKIVAEFAKEVREKSDIFFEVIKDSGGVSHKKPFDAFACYRGQFFAFEFKIGEGKLRGHQEDALLTVATNGGGAYVVRLYDNRDAAFYLAHPTYIEGAPCVICKISDAAKIFDLLCSK